MEQLGAQHHGQVAIDHEFDGGNTTATTNNGGKSSSYLCRQSSTRWSPTSEQIRILKELYYNNGVRSPSAEQIQRISAKLRQYGKIEGKNVFYWFQNHKARERQKKRFTAHADITPTMSMRLPLPPPPPPPPPNCKYHHHYRQDHHIISHPPPQPIYYDNFSSNVDIISPPGANLPPSPSSSSSPGLLSVGNYGYGPVAMEKSFRECSIGSASTEHHRHRNVTWIGVDPYSSSPCPFLDDQKRKYTSKTLETEEQEEEEEIETLPLFPMHGDIKQAQDTNDYFNSGWHRQADDFISTSAAGSRASLELTLNSYNVARFPTTS